MSDKTSSAPLYNSDGDGDQRGAMCTSMGSLSNTFEAASAMLASRWKLVKGSELSAHWCGKSMAACACESREAGSGCVELES